MEWANMTQRPLNLLFLHWKQAFDSVDHTALLVALRRFGLPTADLDPIEQFYHNASFELSTSTGDRAVGSLVRALDRAVRSARTFSSSIVFEDVDNLLLAQGVPTNVWSINHSCSDLEYADDTLLLSLTIPQLQQILSALETEAALYGMHLIIPQKPSFSLTPGSGPKPCCSMMVPTYPPRTLLSTWDPSCHGANHLKLRSTIGEH